MLSGLATLGGSYLVSAWAGLELADSSCVSCRTGRQLVIPIVGPWLFLPDAKGNGKAIVAGLGVAQAVGFVLSIVGITLYSASGPPSDADDVAVTRGSVAFGVWPTSDGALGFAAARF
jgi:hypothetical protein